MMTLQDLIIKVAELDARIDELEKRKSREWDIGGNLGCVLLLFILFGGYILAKYLFGS